MANPQLEDGFHPGALTRSNDGGAWDTQLDPEEMMDVLVEAGWAEEGPEVLDHAFNVAFMESSHRTGVTSDSEGRESLGVFQITPSYKNKELIAEFGKDYYMNLEETALDPVKNARLALKIYRKEGWEPWYGSDKIDKLNDSQYDLDPNVQVNRQSYNTAQERLASVMPRIPEKDPTLSSPPQFNAVPQFTQAVEFN
jgi:hypothetical protein